MDQVVERIARANEMAQEFADRFKIKNETEITLGEFYTTPQGWTRANIFRNGTQNYGFISAL